MRLRPRSLPAGWYPSSPAEIKNVIEDYLLSTPVLGQDAVTGIVPHAGWGYSGAVACEVINHFKRNQDTIVVVGGHLMYSDMVLAAFEEGYSTPLGTIEADLELLKEIEKNINVKEDGSADNTVEVQLPFIKYFFPSSKVLWLRVSPTGAAIELGKIIRMSSEKTGKKVLVLGSTDLTHYGPNYGFSPHGSGEKAVTWVKDVNDKKLINSLIALDADSALELAREDNSACSAGGAVAALSFAKEMGIRNGVLLRYMTSYDISPGSSFVGYAGIIYR
jgi:AmmeMemoRadiSam system protein B